MVVPPVEEQNKLLVKVSEMNRKTDDLIEKLSNKRDLLKEYRQSLISSVVTGKVRVTEDMI